MKTKVNKTIISLISMLVFVVSPNLSYANCKKVEISTDEYDANYHHNLNESSNGKMKVFVCKTETSNSCNNGDTVSVGNKQYKTCSQNGWVDLDTNNINKMCTRSYAKQVGIEWFNVAGSDDDIHGNKNIIDGVVYYTNLCREYSEATGIVCGTEAKTGNIVIERWNNKTEVTRCESDYRWKNVSLTNVPQCKQNNTKIEWAAGYHEYIENSVLKAKVVKRFSGNDNVLYDETTLCWDCIPNYEYQNGKCIDKNNKNSTPGVSTNLNEEKKLVQDETKSTTSGVNLDVPTTPTPMPTVSVVKKSGELDTAINSMNKFFNNAKTNTSAWRTADGKFNSGRLASDITAGAVLGTVGGVVSGVVIKKQQVKKGFEAIHCTIGGNVVADWGDEFEVSFQK